MDKEQVQKQQGQGMKQQSSSSVFGTAGTATSCQGLRQLLPLSEIAPSFQGQCPKRDLKHHALTLKHHLAEALKHYAQTLKHHLVEGVKEGMKLLDEGLKHLVIGLIYLKEFLKHLGECLKHYAQTLEHLRVEGVNGSLNHWVIVLTHLKEHLERLERKLLEHLERELLEQERQKRLERERQERLERLEREEL